MNKLIITGIILTLLDMIYLKFASLHFAPLINIIQGSELKLDLISTILAYIVIVFSLYYFIIRENRSVFDAMLLGWSIYFIYDLTNKALIKKWQWKTVLIDGIWGGILYGLTTYIVYYLR